MEIQNIRYGDNQGIPAMILTIDGKEAWIVRGMHKLTLLVEHNAIFLGPDFEEKTAVTLPADPADSRDEMVLRGFTDDPAIIKLCKEFLGVVNFEIEREDIE